MFKMRFWPMTARPMTAISATCSLGIMIVGYFSGICKKNLCWNEWDGNIKAQRKENIKFNLRQNNSIKNGNKWRVYTFNMTRFHSTALCSKVEMKFQLINSFFFCMSTKSRALADMRKMMRKVVWLWLF
jgi:hypothetical protein